VPPRVSNTLRTGAAALHVLLSVPVTVDGEVLVVPHADVVREALVATLRPVSPWMSAGT